MSLNGADRTARRAGSRGGEAPGREDAGDLGSYRARRCRHLAPAIAERGDADRGCGVVALYILSATLAVGGVAVEFNCDAVVVVEHVAVFVVVAAPVLLLADADGQPMRPLDVTVIAALQH